MGLATDVVDRRPSSSAATVVTLLGVLTALVGAGWGLGVLATHVLGRPSPASGIDGATLRFMVRHRSPGATGLARAVTQLGSGHTLVPLAIIAAAGWWWRRRSWSVAWLLAAAYGGAWVIYTAVKQLVVRSRPPLATRLVTVSGSSFPSGHATQAIAVWGAGAWLATKATTRLSSRLLAGTAAAVVTVAVGATRLYLGVHWCSDVVAGWLLGGAWLGAVVTVAGSGETGQHRGFADPLPRTGPPDPPGSA